MSCNDYRSKSGISQVCLRKGGLKYRNASLGLILIRPNIAETTRGLQKTHYFPENSCLNAKPQTNASRRIHRRKRRPNVGRGTQICRRVWSSDRFRPTGGAHVQGHTAAEHRVPVLAFPPCPQCICVSNSYPAVPKLGRVDSKRFSTKMFGRLSKGFQVTEFRKSAGSLQWTC
jgi:hypothetical protein